MLIYSKRVPIVGHKLLYSRKTFLLTLIVMLCCVISNIQGEFDSCWLTDPCKCPPTRHGRSTGNEEVITQSNLTINQLRDFYKHIKKLYQKRSKKLEGPMYPIKGFNITDLSIRMRRKKHENKWNRKKLNKRYYKILQSIGMVFQKSSTITLRSGGKFNMKAREILYEKAKMTLRSLMCSVQQQSGRKYIQPWKTSIGLPKTADITLLNEIDRSVFKQTMKLLNRLERRVEGRKRRRKSENRKNSDSKIITFNSL